MQDSYINMQITMLTCNKNCNQIIIIIYLQKSQISPICDIAVFVKRQCPELLNNLNNCMSYFMKVVKRLFKILSMKHISVNNILNHFRR